MGILHFLKNPPLFDDGMCYVFEPIMIGCYTKICTQNRISKNSKYPKIQNGECNLLESSNFFFLFFVTWVGHFSKNKNIEQQVFVICEQIKI